ncbi:type II toxin-antitoxin system RelE/ParE family toxin [Niveispirillum irakense]|uniref:type II toxin-antitoxin system RelE/ParE family toxin n=1 Tax=Niveispirillum irakense TaxID=34011 RepID=UPI000419ABDA|nr:type II toxin-antitoxin system RelE/ParE family toxin [Niveispirillum irakense]
MTQRTVIFTAAAERQVERLYDYISAQGGDMRADNYLNRLIQYCEGLALFPERGHRRDDILTGLRIIGFERRTTIAFTITATTVLIEGVFYGGQNLEDGFPT